jgi:hypothetical protein
LEVEEAKYLIKIIENRGRSLIRIHHIMCLNATFFIIISRKVGLKPQEAYVKVVLLRSGLLIKTTFSSPVSNP